jgi:hypothetical protein
MLLSHRWPNTRLNAHVTKLECSKVDDDLTRTTGNCDRHYPIPSTNSLELGNNNDEDRFHIGPIALCSTNCIPKSHACDYSDTTIRRHQKVNILSSRQLAMSDNPSIFC